MRKIPLILTLGFLLGLSTARAADVSVTKAGSEKTLLDWSGFTAGQGASAREFINTLQGDLKRSGWFLPSRPGGGQLSLLGSCVEQGGSLTVEASVYGVVDRKRYIGKTYRESRSRARQMAHTVADEIVEAVTGHKGMASTRIAMVGSRTGKKELYLCDADGGNLVQLTQDGTVSVAPKWGPQAKQLTYTSYLKRFPDIFMINLASGSRNRISKYSGLNTGGVISPNGKDIALILSKDGNPELYVRKLSGGVPTRLTKTAKAVEASPSWSPDGRQLAYVSDRSGRPHIYTISRSGGRPERITRTGYENVGPSWGPNGLIAYSCKLGGRFTICVVDPKTKQTKQLPLDGADYEDPSWAPDGRHIVCTRTERYRSAVYILDTLGDPPLALTNYKGDWYSPAWSPK